MLIDGGACDVGVESTIVDLTGARPRLLRPGRIRRDAIEAVLGEPLGGQDSNAPRASGTLASHYCPVTPVEVVTASTLNDRLAVLDREQRRVGVFARHQPQAPHAVWLQAPEDEMGWEKTIYEALRALDAEGLTRILIAAPAHASGWDAVIDRVSRAAVRS
jgi:L-threonylcarbamoyladenylate synthase